MIHFQDKMVNLLLYLQKDALRMISGKAFNNLNVLKLKIGNYQYHEYKTVKANNF